jgi:hypothetical protein
VLHTQREGRGPATTSVLHVPDCEDAPTGASLLDLEQALNAAERPGVRLCAWCGCEQELKPLLEGFGPIDHLGAGGS